MTHLIWMVVFILNGAFNAYNAYNAGAFIWPQWFSVFCFGFCVAIACECFVDWLKEEI